MAYNVRLLSLLYLINCFVFNRSYQAADKNEITCVCVPHFNIFYCRYTHTPLNKQKLNVICQRSLS